MMSAARLAVALLLAGMFLLSGGVKLRSGRFVTDLTNYRVLPTRMIIPVAIVVPWLEVALGALLILWVSSPIPVYLAALALTMFGMAMAINLFRGRVISCGCRGSDTQISWALVLSNLALAIIASWIAHLSHGVGLLSTAELVATVGCLAVLGLGSRLFHQVKRIRFLSRSLGLLEHRAKA